MSNITIKDFKIFNYLYEKFDKKIDLLWEIFYHPHIDEDGEEKDDEFEYWYPVCNINKHINSDGTLTNTIEITGSAEDGWHDTYYHSIYLPSEYIFKNEQELRDIRQKQIEEYNKRKEKEEQKLEKEQLTKEYEEYIKLKNKFEKE